MIPRALDDFDLEFADTPGFLLNRLGIFTAEAFLERLWNDQEQYWELSPQHIADDAGLEPELVIAALAGCAPSFDPVAPPLPWGELVRA